MIFPPCSPPTYKFRNKCQNTIKYINFDYTKSKYAEMCPFKRKNKKMKRPLIPCVSRGFRIYVFFFMDMIWLWIFILVEKNKN
ncbi:hypothetical protein COL93_28820 [Bacillus toyonensis]|uniref:Uncharacterized protein n=1 Tax=Bacillus toyonensis TaxID=155322 RepID=A0A2C4Q831_9BACI|nr:hypothetical protein COL93_28820 [Bacillus toyonensis]PHD60603.1 hypothetical protein COF40_27500 [Bacillus toyonensis]